MTTGGAEGWPSTPWTLVRAARAGEVLAGGGERARDRLVELYYVPVERFFRRTLRVPEADARDVTHELFARLLEREFLQGITHETSFRGFLKLACRRHCATWRAASAAALARAGAIADDGEPLDDGAIDDAVDDELRRYYVAEAARRVAAELLAQGKPETLAIFEARTRLDGERPEDYASLAARFDLRVYDVRNRLTAARRLFRRALRALASERADDPRAELAELGLLRYLEGA